MNRGWLALMGEAHAEQTRLQASKADEVALARIARREQRKRHRAGLRGLLVHMSTAA